MSPIKSGLIAFALVCVAVVLNEMWKIWRDLCDHEDD
jgi:hypothetical protein